MASQFHRVPTRELGSQTEGRQDIFLNSVPVDGRNAVHLRLARVSLVCSSRLSAYPDGLKSRVLGVGNRPDAVSHQSDLSTTSLPLALDLFGI